MSKVTYREAINRAILEEMAQDDRVVLTGVGVCTDSGPNAGVYKAFPDRVFDSPAAEAGYAGVAIGSSLLDIRPIIDLGACSNAYYAFDQIVSIAAKTIYTYGGQAEMPVTIRCTMSYGNEVTDGPDRLHSLFMAVPGLKVAVPGTVNGVYAALKAAVRDNSPTIIIENEELYEEAGELASFDADAPFGCANVVRDGTDVTLIAISEGVKKGLLAADLLAQKGYGVEVVEPVTLTPLDLDTILESVKKTGRVVIYDPSHRTCSAASEIASLISEHAFSSLRAPIRRLTAPDEIIPYGQVAQDAYFASVEQIASALLEAMAHPVGGEKV